jgi:hypothetical protein
MRKGSKGKKGRKEAVLLQILRTKHVTHSLCREGSSGCFAEVVGAFEMRVGKE